MESLNIYHQNKKRGFTLLETLIVLGIFTVLVGVGGVLGFNSYKGYLFRSERNTAISVLERARSRAIANYSESKHGVCYDNATHSYIIFRGSTCISGASTNEIVPGNPNSMITNFDVIVFDQLTGNLNPSVSGSAEGCANDEKSIKIKESDRESYICINNEGRINW